MIYTKLNNISKEKIFQISANKSPYKMNNFCGGYNKSIRVVVSEEKTFKVSANQK